MTVLDDYFTWHRLQIDTLDIDPAYPVLHSIGSSMGKDDAAWLALHHTTHYQIGSALKSFSYGPGQKMGLDLVKLPTGVERRSLRDPRQFVKHWADLRLKVSEHGGADAFLTPSKTGTEGWLELIERIETVYGNGRWASYKIAEVAQKVLGKKIMAPDAGHADSSGPRKGLARLGNVPPGNSPEVIAYLNKRTADLQRRLGEPDVAHVETSLCDFNSLCKGHYYLGHDIDQQLDNLLAVKSDLTPIALGVRQSCFKKKYLAENRGATGVDKARRTVYRDTGRILQYS